MMEVIDEIVESKQRYEREASPIDRFVHVLLDFLIALATTSLMTVRFKFLSSSFNDFVNENGVYITLTIYFLHTFICELLIGKTFGKFVRNTRVVNENLCKATSKQILKRTFVKLIPFEGALIFSSFRRPLHDTWSQTIVIKKVKL